jgi:non-heme chloroperoxidase
MERRLARRRPAAVSCTVTMKTLLLSLLLIVAVILSAGPSSPQSAFVTVRGVRLHYLEWSGGRGEVLLLIPGFGNDAHIFDSFAPKFTDRFRVLALTRRGSGASDWPKSGYDVATRVEDIRGFLDARGIRKVSLVGHSLAGDELTAFASAYPQRVHKLVYLDAAYDRSKTTVMALEDPSLPPYMKKRMLEAMGSPRAAKIVAKDPFIPQRRAIYVEIMKASLAFRPDYRRVRAPALALYATPKTHPGAARETNPQMHKNMNAWWAANAVPATRASIEQFRREAPRGEIVEMPHAEHHLFLGLTQVETVRRTREFLLR